MQWPQQQQELVWGMTAASAAVGVQVVGRRRAGDACGSECGDCRGSEGGGILLAGAARPALGAHLVCVCVEAGRALLLCVWTSAIPQALNNLRFGGGRLLLGMQGTPAWFVVAAHMRSHGRAFMPPTAYGT